MSTEIRIRQALERAEEYVAYLATMPDKELAKKLDIVHQQSVIAEKEKNTPSLELLEIWRSQIIKARIHKIENNIPDTPSAMELALADMEAHEEKAERRKEILNETKPTIVAEEEINYPEKEKGKENPDKPEQLSLF